MDGKKRGLTWRLQESLKDMDYADDVCLVSHKYGAYAKEIGWPLEGIQEGWPWN